MPEEAPRRASRYVCECVATSALPPSRPPGVWPVRGFLQISLPDPKGPAGCGSIPAVPRPVSATVAAWIGSANLGDELVFKALAAQLAARDVQIAALSVAPDATSAAHGVDSRRRQSALTTRTGLTVLGGGGLRSEEHTSD